MANRDSGRKVDGRALAATVVIVLAFRALSAWAQPPAQQGPSSATKPEPAPDEDWQTRAGGKMAFDVASVKPAEGSPAAEGGRVVVSKGSATFHPPPYPLDNRNAYVPGGRFSAVFPLWTYISFAYKLSHNDEQTRSALAHLPAWVADDRYVIDARGQANATKDQIRLMMQSLLAERFKLAVHFETREVSVLALTLVKPGTRGPKLRPHAEGPPCPDTFMSGPAPSTDVFPFNCETAQLSRTRDGLTRIGSRNTTMALVADAIYSYASLSKEIDKPVVDRTGLAGEFDFIVEYSGSPFARPAQPDADGVASEPQGSFLNAVRSQLGLKLVPARAPIRMLVIDHVERPSEN